jgi:DUF4097 and DUF4098 domain-containing protein YvlB
VSDPAQRRSPLFAGLLLIVLGLIFLIDRFYPHFGLGHLIRLYWPVLIILWGVSKLIDHRSAKKSGEVRGPLLSGGEAALLILLALVLGLFVFRDWLRNEFPGIEIHLPAMERSFSRMQSIPPVEVADGALISIETAHGDIKVTGVDGNELRVSARSSAMGGSESSTDSKLRSVNAVIDRVADGYRIHALNQRSFPGWNSLANVDFEIQVPKTATIAANTALGDVRIENAGASVSVETHKGDVKINGVRGGVGVRGNGGDVEVRNVMGDVTIDGPFLGDTEVSKANGTVRIKSPRTDVTLAQLSGELKLDSDDLSISGAGGSIAIVTHDKDITVQDAKGPLNVADSHGDIDVKLSGPPQADVSLTNDSGDVSLTLPAHSAFQISAVSRSGEVDSDFEVPGVRGAEDSENERLSGVFGAPSGASVPKVSIATSYGTIHVNKSK